MHTSSPKTLAQDGGEGQNWFQCLKLVHKYLRWCWRASAWEWLSRISDSAFLWISALIVQINDSPLCPFSIWKTRRLNLIIWMIPEFLSSVIYYLGTLFALWWIRWYQARHQISRVSGWVQSISGNYYCRVLKTSKKYPYFNVTCHAHVSYFVA